MKKIRLFLYIVRTVTSDYQPKIKDPNYGMSGPNLVDDLLTLATCNRPLRKGIKNRIKNKEIYVVGISPSITNPRRALYLMKVDEAITFQKAWERGETNESYMFKRGGYSPLNSDPSRAHMNGDIIVRSRDGLKYEHVGGVHHNDWWFKVMEGKEVDSNGDVYLVGDSKISKWYGEDGPRFTEVLFQKYWKGYPGGMIGHRIIKDDSASELLDKLFNLTL